MSIPLLEVEALQVQFGQGKKRQTAVDGVSFSIQPGETLGIVGESGSGKSVTSLSIMGLLPAGGHITKGAVRYKKGEEVIDLVQLSPKALRQYRGNEIAMIFQEPMTSLNPVFRCGFQVLEALQWHTDLSPKAARQRVLELFQQVKLPDPERIFTSYPHELSGGQKQRVMIAMALSCQPRLLIADEPTTALDVTVQKAILQLLQELKDQIDAAIIFITHDLGVIGDIADRVVVMYQGQVVEQGSVQQIFHSPAHPYTKGLLACRPPLKDRIKRLPTVSDFMAMDDTGQWIEKTDFRSSETISPAASAARLAELQRQPPLLEVKGLQTWFPKDKSWWGTARSYVKAVTDVTFDVYPGETLGLVGESGCGKTTLGRTLMRLVPAMRGQVTFEGRDVLSASGSALRALRKDMQIIFQDPYSSLNPRMTIGSAIQEPMRVHQLHSSEAARKEMTMQLLGQVGLEAHHYHRYPHEFSGGQRQRICIARALALEPKFIICDESVSALDVSVQAQVLNLLLDLQQTYQLTYIFISHDLSVVHFMSDRIAVMRDGQVVELDNSHEVYYHPKHSYTQTLIQAIPKGEMVVDKL